MIQAHIIMEYLQGLVGGGGCEVVVRGGGGGKVWVFGGRAGPLLEHARGINKVYDTHATLDATGRLKTLQ